MSAGAREAAIGAAAGLARHRRALFADRRILRPSRHLACGSAATRRDGLRCPYHGWKYDWTGQCIEVPSEAEESGFCQKIKLKSYPLVETRRRAVDLYGPARATAAAAGIRIRHGPARTQSYISKRCRNATGCRRSRAASIPATPRGCTAAISRAIRCSPRLKGQRVQSAAIRGRISKWWKARAACSSAPAAMPRTANIIGASRSG